MVSTPAPKKAVALIREAFACRGGDIRTKDAYDLLARLWGYKDWATYCGTTGAASGAGKAAKGSPAVAPASFARTREELEGWQTWVVCSRLGDDGEEELWLLPAGATLERRLRSRGIFLVDDDDAVPLESGFTDDQQRQDYKDLVVATAVACEYPRADRYGFPMMANEREVPVWLEQSLGWGYLADAQGRSEVQVYARDRGDDGMECWWAEVLVCPQVHARLLEQFKPGRVRFDAVWPALRLDEPASAAERQDERAMKLRRRLGQVFADLGDCTLGDVDDALRYGFDPSHDAEAFLRSALRNEQVTLQGPPMSALELHALMQRAIAESSSDKSP